MDSSAINNPETLPSENVEKYFRWITERCQLPSIPLLAGQILKMTQDPDLNVRELCRLLSDDTALTRRILAVARAPYYAQRTTPTTLVEAVNVLGFRTVSSVVVASAASSLCIKGNRISEKLWAHSLGVALGTRVLFKRAGLRNVDHGFLAGLMHDVGEMVLMHGDPGPFEKLVKEVERSQCRMVDREKESYGFDHMMIGAALLRSWNIDPRINQAVLYHHPEVNHNATGQLGLIVAAADYLCFKAGLGFFGEPPIPGIDILDKCGCISDEKTKEVIKEIRAAYAEESALFTPA